MDTWSATKVRTKVINDTQHETLFAEIDKHVEKDAEVFTDQFRGYSGVEKEYILNVINHAEKYVDGNVHTCNIDNYWSLLKRGVKGTYLSVEPFHLFRYLVELTFMFNERKGKDADRFVQTMKQIAGKQLTFDELLGKKTGH